MTTGRNFDEILRAIDSIQLTAKHQVATPANWKQGEDVIITAAVSNEDAIKRFGAFETILPYLQEDQAAFGLSAAHRNDFLPFPRLARQVDA